MYDQETGTLIGYTNVDQVNNHLLAFERSLSGDSHDRREPASSMLTFMVKGLFTPLRFPYVHFSCSKPSGDQMFPLFWEVVKRVERIGLKVILCSKTIYVVHQQVLAATFDGASNNRKMVELQDTTRGKLTHKVPNIHSNDGERFFSDPPHLIKTARNCLASMCRFMWVCVNETL